MLEIAISKIISLAVLARDAKFTYRPVYWVLKPSKRLGETMPFVNLQSHLRLVGHSDTRNMQSNVVNFNQHPENTFVCLK